MSAPSEPFASVQGAGVDPPAPPREPGRPPKEAPPARPAATLGRLLRYARPYAGAIALATTCMLLLGALRNGRAYLTMPLLDDVLIPGAAAAAALRERAAEHFIELSLLALVIVALTPLAIYGSQYLVQWVLARIQVDLQRQMATKLMRLPLAYHRSHGSGDAVTRTLVDGERVQQALALVFGQFLLSLSTIALGIVAMLAISWQLTLVSLASAPLVAGVLVLFSGRLRRSARKRQRQLGEVTQRLLGILSGIKVIKAFRGEELERAAFERETETLFRRHMRVVKNTVLARSLVETLNVALGIFVLVLGTWLVLEGRWELTAGKVGAFATVMATSYKPVKTLSRGWTHLMDTLASVERFFGLLDRDEDVADPPGARPLDGIREAIRFEHVSFSYGGEPVLRDVSLEVPAGRVVAIVGPTGGGKTTLVDLLLRFYEPEAGRITVDGRELRSIARASLLDQCAVVTQEPFLFDTTIRENVRYGRPEASEKAFAAAIHAANVDEFVDQLPAGLETPVGEFGLRLSGGQRQRITIARAILRQPQLLILDEATSALDAKTERGVQRAIEALRGQCTVFVIAHRLSTVRHADEVLVLENGRITQAGPHETLMAEAGLYRELVRLQLDDGGGDTPADSSTSA